MNALKRNAMTFGITFCISILIFGVAAYIITSVLFGNSVFDTDNTNAVKEDLLVGFEEAVDTAAVNGKTFSVLLGATDYQPKVLPDADYTLDTLLYVRFSCNSGKVIFLCISPNTRVEIKKEEMTLAEIYAESGFSAVCNNVESLLGLTVDYYGLTSLAYFDKMIDAIGGIDYDVPIDMSYIDEKQDLYIDLEAGEQHLDGEAALNLLRYVSDGKEARMERHAEFFKAFAETFTQLSYKDQASSLRTTIDKYVDMDFTEDDLLKYIDTIYNYSAFQSVIISYPGNYYGKNENEYFDPDTEEAIEMLKEYKY